MTDDRRRKGLTFEQAEGAAPLPAQLKPKEISNELRAVLWLIMNEELDAATGQQHYNWGKLLDPWLSILRSVHVFRFHRMIDEFSLNADYQKSAVKAIIANGNYLEVFGFLEYILRLDDCPRYLAKQINDALEFSRAAYRVVDDDTIVPVASEVEGGAIVEAFQEIGNSVFVGANKHLKAAAASLTSGEWADSIRESILAVESVAKVWANEGQTLTPALKALAKADHIHPSLNDGFAKLYGFTSDEKGIRHALLEKGVANVGEDEALYMFGSCAAFAAYMVRKARKQGLAI